MILVRPPHIPREAQGPVLHVKQLAHTDIPSISEIHLAAFPNSHLTILGRNVVQKYYEWQFKGPHDMVALGAFYDHELLGYCIGGIFRGSLSGFLRKNLTFLATQVALHPWLLMRSSFREHMHIGANLLRRTRKRYLHTQSRRSLMPPFGILSIATHPERQRRGVGKVLMAAAEATAVQRGFREMRLTVRPTNEQAIHFYEYLGWERVSKDGVWSGSMRKTFQCNE